MGACAGREETPSSSIPAPTVPVTELNGETEKSEADLTVKARAGAKLGPKELQLLGKYDEVGEQGNTRRKYYKKIGANIFLYWCDGRTGAKYSDSWWFSTKTDGTDCLSFCPEKEKKEKSTQEELLPPPVVGWQTPAYYFFQAPTPTPIYLVLKGPPPPPGVVARVEKCGEGCYEFLVDLKDAMRQRNKSKDAKESGKSGKYMQVVSEKVALAKGKTAEAREIIQDKSAKMYAKASERYPNTTAKAEEKYNKVKTKANDEIVPVIRRKTEDAVEIARTISASSADFADKAKTKAKEAAQDFQDKQLPVIKQKTKEAVEQYGPVVADNVSNACNSICDCLGAPQPQPRSSATITDQSGTKTSEAPASTTQGEPGPASDKGQVLETKEVYIVTRSEGLPVNKTMDRGSPEVGQLPKGSTVIVLEIAEKADKGRTRARIESPAGWITAWMSDKSVTFIEKAPKSSKQLDKLNPISKEEFQRRKDVYEE